MRNIKSLFLIFFVAILISCNDDILDKTYRNENYVFYKEYGKNGEWRKLDLNTKFKRPKSLTTYFFANGNKYAELEIIDSLPNRIVKYFDKENGSLIRTSIFKDDSMTKDKYQNGYHQFYYSNLGQIKSKGLIEKNLREGKWEFFRQDDGTLEQTLEYSKGIMHGAEKNYWSNGNLKNSANHKNGELNGKTIHYYESGEIEEISYLKSGKVHGTLTEYHKNGNIKSKCTYWNGKKKDTSKFYYENGDLRKLAVIDLDTLSELSVNKIFEYYETGEIKSRFDSQEFGMTGKLVTYHKNGNVDLKGFTKNGKLHGKIEYFDPNGNSIKTLIVENGVQIDSL